MSQYNVCLEAFFAEGKIARVVWAEATKQWLGCLLIKTLPLHVLDELVITLKRSTAGITNVVCLSAKKGKNIVGLVCIELKFQIL